MPSVGWVFGPPVRMKASTVISRRLPRRQDLLLLLFISKADPPLGRRGDLLGMAGLVTP